MSVEELKLLTFEEVCTILRISRRTGIELFKAEGFPAMKIGGSFRVREDRLLAWLEENEGKQFKIPTMKEK